MKNGTIRIVDSLITRKPELAFLKDDLLQVIDELSSMNRKGHKLLICGNGRFCGGEEQKKRELMKKFCLPRPLSKDVQKKLGTEEWVSHLETALPAINLGAHTSLLTAVLNDQKQADVHYAQQVLGYGQKGDILVCISTSGNSSACVHAAQVAKALGLKVLSLTGKKDSHLSSLSDWTIRAPETETYLIQEIHISIYHTLCLSVEYEMFGE